MDPEKLQPVYATPFIYKPLTYIPSDNTPLRTKELP
jgi:hypothetical protein